MTNLEFAGIIHFFGLIDNVKKIQDFEFFDWYGFKINFINHEASIKGKIPCEIDKKGFSMIDGCSRDTCCDISDKKDFIKLMLDLQKYSIEKNSYKYGISKLNEDSNQIFKKVVNLLLSKIDIDLKDEQWISEIKSKRNSIFFGKIDIIELFNNIIQYFYNSSDCLEHIDINFEREFGNTNIEIINKEKKYKLKYSRSSTSLKYIIFLEDYSVSHIISKDSMSETITIKNRIQNDSNICFDTADLSNMSNDSITIRKKIESILKNISICSTTLNSKSKFIDENQFQLKKI